MAKKVDDNGWWIIKDNPLSKVGIYPYLGKQIDDSLEPNKVYRVFRPAEELLNKETVKSFNLVPLVNDHEMLGKDFSPAEKKGIDGIIYNPRVAHENMLIGNIKIYSEKMMKDIKNGKKELSMGYTCTYDLTPGDWDGQHYDVVQRNLRGNHVALVDRGRMGSDVRVYDKHICCDSMDIVGKVKKVPAKDLTHETWQLRKDTGLNYVTKRKEGTINRLIRESGLPLARRSEAINKFGNHSYRNRFDAKFKDDEAWLNAQKVRFKQTRKKVGWQKMLEMPSYQKYQAKLAELQDILDRRNEIEHEVYGDRAGLDTAWIKVPGEEQNEPNIMDRVVAKSAEAAAIMALLSTVLNMNKKKKKSVNDGVEMNIFKKKAALDKVLNKSLYKLGQSYGKQLAKIYGKKSAKDIATQVGLDILGLDADNQEWITVRGKHIPIEKGQSKKQAINKAFSNNPGKRDQYKWRYSKNAQGAGLSVGTALVGGLADKIIKNKKPSMLKDALVEGGIQALGTGAPISGMLANMRGGLFGGPSLSRVAAPIISTGAYGALNSLARNQLQKSFPKLSSAQAQGLASGALGTVGGGVLGHLISKGSLGGSLGGALAGGMISGLGGLTSRWLANKLYEPMSKSELGKNKRRK